MDGKKRGRLEVLHGRMEKLFGDGGKYEKR